MRTIKFRAWYKGEKYPFDEQNLEDYEKPRMIYDVQNAYDGGGFVDEFNGLGYVSAFSSFMDEENFVLMQYTGLTDKNGKEIYEGDIVRFQEIRDDINYPIWTGVVKHANGSFYIERPVSNHYRWIDYEVEVIGNEYELEKSNEN